MQELLHLAVNFLATPGWGNEFEFGTQADCSDSGDNCVEDGDQILICCTGVSVGDSAFIEYFDPHNGTLGDDTNGQCGGPNNLEVTAGGNPKLFNCLDTNGVDTDCTLVYGNWNGVSFGTVCDGISGQNTTFGCGAEEGEFVNAEVHINGQFEIEGFCGDSTASQRRR